MRVESREGASHALPAEAAPCHLHIFEHYTFRLRSASGGVPCNQRKTKISVLRTCELLLPCRDPFLTTIHKATKKMGSVILHLSQAESSGGV